MPFKRSTQSSSSAAVATVPATVEAVTEQVATPTAPAAAPVATSSKLADQIEDYSSEVSAALQESMLITPDAEFLPPALVDGLKQVAAKLGFAYDPATMGSFYFVVTQTAAKYLSGPALVHLGGVPAIRWGDQYIPLGADVDLFSDTWRFFVGGENEQSYLVFDPKGCYFPVSVKPDVATADEAKQFRKEAGTFDKMGDLVTWLRNGIAPQGLYKLEDKGAFEAQSVSEEMEPRNEGGTKYRIVDAIYEDDTPCRWYVQDAENVNWGRLTYPCVITRNGQLLDIEQPTGNLVYKIQAPIMKMGDALKEGKTYKVLAYEESQGKFGLEVTIDVEIDGAKQTVRTNKAICDRIMTLKGKGQADFKENPAHLMVDTITTGKKDGKTRVSARLITKSDLENPLMQRLQNLQRGK